MKKITVLLTLTVLASFALPGRFGSPQAPRGTRLQFGPALAWAASPQAPQEQAKSPQWKSREEYDAFQAMSNEKDLHKKITLADAFLQKYADTDFKDLVYVVMMQTYAQLNDAPKAMDAARKALQANPDKLEALTYLSYAFPFVFKATDPDAVTQLSQAENDAKHGLDVLQKLQKPAQVTDEQFNQYVKSQRAVFNGLIGFVALQRKDYAAAVTSLKAAVEDNPSDAYAFYRLGVAYVSSEPRDYDNGVWNLARSSSLAKASNNPAQSDIDKYLKQVYISYHGNDEGLAGIVTQAAASPTPPGGFKVEPMKIPEKTGNPNIDNFNQLATPLKLGGERAQKVWDSLKGQQLGLGGFVDSVEKGTDANTYLVHIDVLDQSKAAEGVYDIEIKDSTQPNAKNLSKGDPVRFQGTIDSYTATPSFVLTLVGTINPEDVPDQPKAAPKAKPKAKPRATTRRTPRR
ncbi:MAG: tetratricopeptide repeat protein [Acidobacteriia bacterium]|nr:tetratricopeptide repeat protein [Terriglobia bacterium]